MVKLFGKSAFAGAVLVAVSACGGQSGGKVYERVASADGALEAVLMLCPMASDGNVLMLTGAVFDTKGEGCQDFRTKALAGFQTSRAVVWQDGKAVYELDGDRTVVGRFAQGEAPLDLIQLQGNFEGADIPNED